MSGRKALVDPETDCVAQIGIGAVGRLEGHIYARQLDQSERAPPTAGAFLAELKTGA